MRTALVIGAFVSGVALADEGPCDFEREGAAALGPSTPFRTIPGKLVVVNRGALPQRPLQHVVGAPGKGAMTMAVTLVARTPQMSIKTPPGRLDVALERRPDGARARLAAAFTNPRVDTSGGAGGGVGADGRKLPPKTPADAAAGP